MAWQFVAFDANGTDPDISTDSVVGIWQNEIGREIRTPYAYTAEDVEREYPSETLSDLQRQLAELSAKIEALT